MTIQEPHDEFARNPRASTPKDVENKQAPPFTIKSSISASLSPSPSPWQRTQKIANFPGSMMPLAKTHSENTQKHRQKRHTENTHRNRQKNTDTKQRRKHLQNINKKHRQKIHTEKLTHRKHTQKHIISQHIIVHPSPPKNVYFTTVLSIRHARNAEMVAKVRQKFAFYHNFQRPIFTFCVKGRSAERLKICILPEFWASDIHFLHEGFSANLKICMLPQFWASDTHEVTRRSRRKVKIFASYHNFYKIEILIQILIEIEILLQILPQIFNALFFSLW